MQPGVQLIEILNDLRKVLNDSGVERTIGLRDAMGEDCPFFGKSIYFFLLHDYPKIKPLLNEAAGLLEDCEK